MEHKLGANHSNTDFSASRIVESLDKKRKQLDLEIAEFKARRDEEYRVFEQQLRCETERPIECNSASDPRSLERKQVLHQEQPVDRDAATQDIQEQPVDRDAATQDITGKNRLPAGEQKHVNGESVDEQSSSLALIDSSISSNLSSGGMSSVSSGHAAESGFHEREVEFRGLFTPSYLPLLETATQQLRGFHDKGPSPASSKLDDLAVVDHDITSSFSSSATLPTPRFPTSPPPPRSRPLSASVPRHHSSQKRQYSLRADTTMTSLRSSLRDPKQLRSPKRVLFSINDVVVSPSTSPVLQRNNQANLSSGFFDVPSRFQNSGAPKTGKGEAYHAMDWTEDDSNRSESHGSNGALPTAAANGHQLKQPINVSPMIGGEDFEHVGGEDELFLFDEDMDIGELDHERDDREGELGSEDEEDGKDALSASSPHAGSLPIEIRWPIKNASGD